MNDAETLTRTEESRIERLEAELLGAAATGRDALGSICSVLNARQRYFGQVGEHLGVTSFDGIQAVDRLDERLVRALLRVSRDYLDRVRPDPGPEARAAANTAVAWPRLPEYPTGYMVLGAARDAVEAFAKGIDPDAHPADLPAREDALILWLATRVAGFVESRDTPLKRHFGDVAREYSVVARLRCVCGADGAFKPVRQTLLQAPGGTPADEVEASCSKCGTTVRLQFPLPHFGDLKDGLR